MVFLFLLSGAFVAAGYLQAGFVTEQLLDLAEKIKFGGFHHGKNSDENAAGRDGRRRNDKSSVAVDLGWRPDP